MFVINKVFFVLFILLFIMRLSKIEAKSFTCLNGDYVDLDEVCDGRADCLDSSDERIELCSSYICRKDQFKCNRGACVSRASFCNGINDCVDGSDEFNCGKNGTSCK